MTLENKLGQELSPQEFSESESALQNLNSQIWNTHEYLEKTFFQNDTWRVWQAGLNALVGVPLLEYADNEPDWERERQLRNDITVAIGPRFQYLDSAYHFTDSLSAYGNMSSDYWLQIKIKRTNDSREQVSSQILAKTRQVLAEETQIFGKFLSADIFEQAFVINLDRKTGEYTISDLQLDPNQLKTEWNKLLSF